MVVVSFFFFVKGVANILQLDNNEKNESPTKLTEVCVIRTKLQKKKSLS